jgi:methylthioribulose-1-phosphate dehydratase
LRGCPSTCGEGAGNSTRCPSPPPQRVITELSRQFYEQGWATGTGGGISVRQGGRVYMAPSGVQKERIAEDDIFELDHEGNVLRSPDKPG